MTPDSLILQMLVERQQEINTLRDENARMRAYIDQRAVEETDDAPILDDEEVR